MALAKREKDEATELLRKLLEDRDPYVRDYAMLGLAAFGDAQAWDDAFVRLNKLTARPRADSVPDPLVTVVIYLIRHMDSDTQRAYDVRSILHKRWGKLSPDTQTWLRQHWPTVTGPHESPLTDPQPAHA